MAQSGTLITRDRLEHSAGFLFPYNGEVKCTVNRKYISDEMQAKWSELIVGA